MHIRTIDEIGNVGRSARMFLRVRRELDLTQTEMAKVLGLSQMAISYIEQGKRRPTPEQCRKLRNLAFHQKVPFAAAVFDEHDDPDLTECPMCVAIRRHRRLNGLEVEE